MKSRPFVAAGMLASMIGAGATATGLGAIVDGFERAFSAQGHDMRVVVMSRGATTEQTSLLPVSTLGAITSQAEAKLASPEVLVPTVVYKEAGEVTAVAVRALDPAGFELYGIRMLSGRMPTPGEAEFIAGENLRRNIPWIEVGTTLPLLGETYTCVGVFRGDDIHSGEIVTTRAHILRDPARIPLSVVWLETGSPEDAQQLVARFNHSHAYGTDAQTEREFTKAVVGDRRHLLDSMLLVFVFVLGGTALASSVFLSMLQEGRLGEFSTLRAIGFKRRAVAAIVLYETELIAIVGGAIGALLAVLGLRDYTVQVVGAQFVPTTFAAPVRAPIALIAIAIMLLVGVIGALGPMYRAHRIEIGRGLREE
jgi:putative ABC transport system permease protein